MDISFYVSNPAPGKYLAKNRWTCLHIKTIQIKKELPYSLSIFLEFYHCASVLRKHISYKKLYVRK